MNSLQYSRDVLKKFKERLFMVRVPRSLLYSPEEIKLFGLPITYGEDGANKKSINDLDTVMLPASKLVEIYKNGGTIYIKDPNEIMVLGELLTEVADIYKYSVNVNDLEEKAVIEEFLEALTGLNSGFIERKIKEELEEDDGFGMGVFKEVNTRPKIDISKFEV